MITDELHEDLMIQRDKLVGQLRTMLDIGLDKKDETKLVAIIEGLIDIKLKRLGLMHPAD